MLMQISARSLLALAGLFSLAIAQPALARPFVYTSAFEYGTNVNECLDSAEQVLSEAGFTEYLERDVRTDKIASVSGEMPSDAVSADILCDQSLGITVLSVAGLDADLTYEKYDQLFDTEW